MRPYSCPTPASTSTLSVRRASAPRRLRIGEACRTGRRDCPTTRPVRSSVAPLRSPRRTASQYQIDGNTGDTRTISDRNGNTLTFTDDGHRPARPAQEIQFERDPQGRITAVIDPMGERVQYEYDAAGDLVAVTDREGNTTRFRLRRTDSAALPDRGHRPARTHRCPSEYDDRGPPGQDDRRRRQRGRTAPRSGQLHRDDQRSARQPDRLRVRHAGQRGHRDRCRRRRHSPSLHRRDTIPTLETSITRSR